jgi:O-antigen/teichoic acid export membrane protein
MSNCFNRLPIIFFSGFLSTSSFVVFSSFYTLFMRGELILGAAIQALWGEKNNYNNNKLLRISFCGFLMGLVILFCCWFFGRQIVELYLGGSYSDSYNTILLPAIYMCLYFPFFVLRTDIMYEGQTRAVSICLIFGIFIQALCSKIDFSFNALKMASFPISITFVALLYYLIRKRKLL